MNTSVIDMYTNLHWMFTIIIIIWLQKGEIIIIKTNDNIGGMK